MPARNPINNKGEKQEDNDLNRRDQTSELKGGKHMDIWNVWTALATGLVIGTNVGMVLTALLTISSADDSRQPDAIREKAESPHVNALRGNNVAIPPDSIHSPADPRAPLPYH